MSQSETPCPIQSTNSDLSDQILLLKQRIDEIQATCSGLIKKVEQLKYAVEDESKIELSMRIYSDRFNTSKENNLFVEKEFRSLLDKYNLNVEHHQLEHDIQLIYVEIDCNDFDQPQRFDIMNPSIIQNNWAGVCMMIEHFDKRGREFIINWDNKDIINVDFYVNDDLRNDIVEAAKAISSGTNKTHIIHFNFVIGCDKNYAILTKYFSLDNGSWAKNTIQVDNILEKSVTGISSDMITQLIKNM